MSNSNWHDKVRWILIGALFFLRIIIYTITPMAFPRSTTWVEPFYQIGTYSVTAILVWWECENLADFHVDALALALLIFGGPLGYYMYHENASILPTDQISIYFLNIPIGLALGIVILATRPKIMKVSFNSLIWTVTGIGIGIGLGVYFAYVKSDRIPYSGSYHSDLLFYLPLQQMLNAGLTEEPFFRGFLWGGLRKMGMREIHIWLIQAGLFWIGHIYALPHAPWSFFWIVPPAGLILGLLAWRSRTFSTSMIAHGLANGFAIVLSERLRIF